MYCPNCKDIKLKSYISPLGVEIDFCPQCYGNWLDKGAIIFFVKNQEFVEKEIKNGLKKAIPSNKLSPKTNEIMKEFDYLKEIKIDYCPKSEGLWFDKDEFSKFSQISNLNSIDYSDVKSEDLINKNSIYFKEEINTIDKIVSLIKLPNLMLTSIVTISTVFSLFTLFFLLILTFVNLGLYISIGISIVFSLIGFFIGPMLYDFSITMFMSGKLVEFGKLPEHIQNMSTKITDKYGIKIPDFYIIKDNAPQAFTYGYSPNSGRIVISEGLLNLLNEDEVDSVIAHEYGHIIHWDMVLMSIIMVVPRISHLIYKHFIEQLKNKNSGNNKDSAKLAIIALVAFIIFYVSQLFVLYFSRVREYHADRFSANFTQSPHALANALVKIGYGLIKTSDETVKKEHTLSSSPLNIFDNNAIPAFAISSFSSHHSNENIHDLKEVMKWDIWNPWSSWYELNSTHPLIANRLLALSNIAETQGKKPFFDISDKKPESYYDDFLIDFVVYITPIIAILFLIFYNLILVALQAPSNNSIVPISLFVFGISSIVKHFYSYRNNYFPEMSIVSLLKKIKVSEVRPVPCKIKGKIIGKGIPGYIASEDFIIQDSSGILYIDYKQPLGIWEFFFGLFKADKFINKEVEVVGWYRRAPVPFLEIYSIRALDDEKLHSTSSYKSFQLIIYIIITFVGILLIR